MIAATLEATTARRLTPLTVHVRVVAIRDPSYTLAIELDQTNGDAHNGCGFVRAIQGDYSGGRSKTRNTP